MSKKGIEGNEVVSGTGSFMVVPGYEHSTETGCLRKNDPVPRRNFNVKDELWFEPWSPCGQSRVFDSKSVLAEIDSLLYALTVSEFYKDHQFKMHL